eukprot:9030950-Pyramimonas_sp.AAC.1
MNTVVLHSSYAPKRKTMKRMLGGRRRSPSPRAERAESNGSVKAISKKLEQLQGRTLGKAGTAQGPRHQELQQQELQQQEHS